MCFPFVIARELAEVLHSHAPCACTCAPHHTMALFCEQEAEAKAIEECSEEDKAEWEAMNEKGKEADPIGYQPIRLTAWLAEREAEERRQQEAAEEAALMDRELRSSNDQMVTWHQRQKEMLTCTCSGEAAKVLLGDAANSTLGRLLHAFSSIFFFLLASPSSHDAAIWDAVLPFDAINVPFLSSPLSLSFISYHGTFFSCSAPRNA